jgi:hypothetical protein
LHCSQQGIRFQHRVGVHGTEESRPREIQPGVERICLSAIGFVNYQQASL